MPYKDRTTDIARKKAVEASQRYRDKNREKVRNSDRQRKLKKKQMLLDHLGGKCVGCGTTENLQFDHIDRTTKNKKFKSIQGSLNRKLEDLIAEVDKCQLLCRECHITKSRVCYDNEKLLMGYSLKSIQHIDNKIIITYESTN